MLKKTLKLKRVKVKVNLMVVEIELELEPDKQERKKGNRAERNPDNLTTPPQEGAVLRHTYHLWRII